MKLLKVSKSGALHFQLSDGRIGITYPSGYIRVNTHHENIYYKAKKLYQINRGELITNSEDRVKRLLEFNNKNCIL